MEKMHIMYKVVCMSLKTDFSGLRLSFLGKEEGLRLSFLGSS